MAYFRITYKDKLLTRDLAQYFLHADVIQHKALAAISNDEQDLVIANKLIRLGFFSPIYTKAGFKMLHDKADQGYIPAQQQILTMQINTTKTLPKKIHPVQQ